MKRLAGTIVTALFISVMTTAALASSSDPSGGGENAPAMELTGTLHGGGAEIDAAVGRFTSTDPPGEAGDGNMLKAGVPISTATLLSTFTRITYPMDSYYTRTGTNSKQAALDISRMSALPFAAYATPYAVRDGEISAVLMSSGHLVGSGVVVGSVSLPSIESGTSGETVLFSNSGNGSSSSNGNTYITINQNGSNSQPAIPIPLPFYLMGSGLASVLYLRSQAERRA